MTFGVHSEIGKLRSVIVCRPGLAHKRLTPDNCRSLLYDDVIWVEKAQEHHAYFVQKMREYGVEVLELHHMLAEVCLNEAGRDWILDRFISEDQIDSGMLREPPAWLKEMPATRLAEHLIGGIIKSEFPFHPKGLLADYLNNA